ncbi:hypothetical protein [Lactococcus petauri]|jgi:hypothetical protein|uniref:hypothetical protein n=1 Tax=Lactococcus petauri TaxID=1940789 RepID=UPI001302D58A|nr:hypothetical protein [Lactococcus petauri]USI66621.1 hypothetical protein LMK05_04920 [Lactococcus petauri]USI69066.1 hypothetical protein LMK04_04855 [Lactococcus petauri]WJE13733.1 hypothetical protein QR692_04820 [Lactococcus petauri]
MIEEKDPVLQKIEEQEAKIMNEVRLKKKSKTVNVLVVCTSTLLLLGIIVGLARIMLSM